MSLFPSDAALFSLSINTTMSLRTELRFHNKLLLMESNWKMFTVQSSWDWRSIKNKHLFLILTDYARNYRRE